MDITLTLKSRDIFKMRCLKGGAGGLMLFHATKVKKVGFSC